MEFFVWNADPVFISIAGLAIHWYGIFFALAIVLGSHIMKWIVAKEDISTESLDTLFTYSIIGIITGARLAHCLFYEPEFYLANPLKILAIWEGGLASHGGGLGLILAVYFYSKKHHIKLLWLLDRIAIPTALFGFFVRVGNFINSEIVGTPTDFPLAVVFSRVDNLARHPVQLYEAFSYGMLFILLLTLFKCTHIKRYTGALLGICLCLVFSARFLLEFVKTQQAAYTTELSLTTGQLLSVPFLMVGILLLYFAVRSRHIVKGDNM